MSLLRRYINNNVTLRIAFTHLLGKRRQTIVAMLGVTFGIAVFIFQAGLITGFQGTFKERVLNTTAHIHIFYEAEKDRKSLLEEMHLQQPGQWIVVSGQKPKVRDQQLKNATGILKDLEHDPEVIGVAPGLNGQAIFRNGTAQKSGKVAGIDVRMEDRLFQMGQYMRMGDPMKLETMSNGIILGKGLADEIGAGMNDVITVISQSGVSLDLKVIGIHESGLAELDKSRAFVRIITAQKLLNVSGDHITDINIKVRDIDRSDLLTRRYQNKYGYKAMDWKETNANTFSVFKVQNMVTYLIIISILIVSGFGIFNIQMMIIYEKMNDIAILKAIGYKDRDIKRIFLTESIVIGIAGGIIGLLLGYVVTLIVGSIPLNIGGFVTIKYLAFNRDPLFFVMAFGFGIIATSIAGYFPARKAAKVDPVNIIRGK